jgi:uncharacterized membrane protein YphA (DoxX/SURF4 family)
MSTVYEVNKGINRTIEFKGVKGQYITYMAIGLVLILLLFAILYVCGLNTYVCAGVIIPIGIVFIITIQRMSAKYGEHGLVKKIATHYLPSSVLSRTRQIFIHLKDRPDAKA